jgi:hypothetical protein
MDYAGLSPDGVQEAPGTAQIISAISKGFGVGPGTGVIYWKNDTPLAHGDRVLLLQGQTILISAYAALVAATYCGDANNATAPAFYKTSDSGGTTRDTAGTYFVLPDARGLSLKNIGDATVNGRSKVGPVELGEVQEDAFQGWQSGARNSGITYFGSGLFPGYETAGSALANYVIPKYNTAGQGVNQKITAINDGTNGVPRTGTNTRDSSMGTNFGITY